MDKKELKTLLESVSQNKISVDEAILKLKIEPFENIDIANLDLHRGVRQGISEIVYGAGKTPHQINEICHSLWNSGQKTIIVTRMSREAAEMLVKDIPFIYYDEPSFGVVGKRMDVRQKRKILVVTGGTSDIPVAEEAALTAEYLGNNVERLYDVGVSGLHRLLEHIEEIMNANVVITIAGMEGALASVVGGLVDCPVIAVPTSVGYGTSFGGVTALLSMLNSCASGVSVVNIDNGFGAGYLANQINNMNI